MKRKTLPPDAQEPALSVVDDMIAVASAIEASPAFTTDDLLQLERSLGLDPSAALPIGMTRRDGRLRLDMLVENLPKIMQAANAPRRVASTRYANTSDADILEQAQWVPVELTEDGDRLLLQINQLHSGQTAPPEVTLSINGQEVACEVLPQPAEMGFFLLSLPNATFRKISLVESADDHLLIKLFT